MTSTFNSAKYPLSSAHSTSPILSSSLSSSMPHWLQSSHETVLSSNDPHHPIQLALGGGAENGQFIYVNESISLLKTKAFLNIVKGSKVDYEEIVVELDQHQISGCTLADVQSMVEQFSSNGRQIKLKTIKSGLTKDLRQFLDGRFQKGSIDHELQQTIRDNLYMRTVPCTTRPPRAGEINGQDYTFLTMRDFRALEKAGNLLESGVYKGHYYGTPRPLKETMISNSNLVRRSNSADEMFQNDRSRVLLRANGNTDDQMLGRLTGETVTCSLKKSLNGFGFTIIDGLERGEHYLQVKDILPDGPAARDGKLQRGDILVYVNDVHVLGYSHTDVVRIFQGLSVGDALNLTVCRGYPLTLNLNDPQIDVVSLNGVHYSTNGTHKEHLQSTTESPFHTVRIRKGDHGFGFTIADSTSGQRIKAIVDRQRCRGFSENDLLVSINGQDLSDKQHNDVVNILIHCPKDAETTFVVRRGDSDVNNNTFAANGPYHPDKQSQENSETHAQYSEPRSSERSRSKTPTPFGAALMSDTLPLRSRTPLPSTNNHLHNHSISPSMAANVDRATTYTPKKFSPDSVYTFDRQSSMSRSARDVRSTHAPLSRSRTPGPEFGATPSSLSFRMNGTQPRSKTPTASDMSSLSIANSRLPQAVHRQYSELVVNLTLARPNDGFGLRILGGEEEKSQVCIGHIVAHSPADIDGRLCPADEIIQIDGHSTIRATHEKVVQLMQQAKENQRVRLIVRRYTQPKQTETRYATSAPLNAVNRHDFQTRSTSLGNGIRYITLHKTNEHQSFGFVIISSQQTTGAIVGKIIPNSPADLCGQLHINDRILAVNDIDLTHMLHTDVVNLIKDSGRTIQLKIGPPLPYDDSRSHEIDTSFNGMRPSSSSPSAISNGHNRSIRNAYSHNPLNVSDRTLNRPSSRANGALIAPSLPNDYFIVDLHRPYLNSSFGFSIRGGREFSIPLFILKVADDGLAAQDGRMKPGDQIIEVNAHSTYGMTHNEAISLIRTGGLHVRLLLRETHAPPPSLHDVKLAMGNGMEYSNHH